jgi:hypothetical protein
MTDMRRNLRRLFCCSAAALALGCQDVTAPVVPTTDTPSRLTRPAGSPDTVYVLRRLQPLPRGVTAIVRVGPSGGVVSLPAAGATLRIPAGALRQRTTIEITARAGSDVAYELQPHGLHFARPLTFEQDLRATEAGRPGATDVALEGIYFDGGLARGRKDRDRHFVEVREHRPSHKDKDTDALAFTIDHFSGYLISTGRAVGELVDAILD